MIKRMMNYFLEKLYGPLAWGYDFVATIVSNGKWNDWTSIIEKYLSKNDKLLEVGLGTGVLNKKLFLSGYHLVGSDLSRQMIKIAAKRLGSTQPNLIRAENKCLPFQGNYFTKIIATFPSNYIFTQEFLSESRRVLESNGKIIILQSVIFVKNDLISLFYRFLYWISGQFSTKDESEKIIRKVYGGTENVTIDWVPYENVELCFVIIKI